jgi:hypothetical protein
MRPDGFERRWSDFLLCGCHLASARFTLELLPASSEQFPELADPRAAQIELPSHVGRGFSDGGNSTG